MNRETYDAIAAKIAAIKADPLAWARQEEERHFAAMAPSERRHARRMNDAELAEHAATELAFSEKILPSEAPAAAEPVDMQRLAEANRRTHAALYGGQY